MKNHGNAIEATRSIAIIVFAALMVFALTACGDGAGGNDGDPSIYIAGYYNDGTKDLAYYWKDGYGTALATDADAHATGITVAGADRDVYIAGYTGNLLAPPTVACYWKNGFKTDIYDGAGNSSALAIVVK